MSDIAGLLVEEISKEYELSDDARVAIAQLIFVMYDDGGFSMELIYDYLTPILKALVHATS